MTKQIVPGSKKTAEQMDVENLKRNGACPDRDRGEPDLYSEMKNGNASENVSPKIKHLLENEQYFLKLLEENSHNIATRKQEKKKLNICLKPDYVKPTSGNDNSEKQLAKCSDVKSSLSDSHNPVQEKSPGTSPHPKKKVKFMDLTNSEFIEMTKPKKYTGKELNMQEELLTSGTDCKLPTNKFGILYKKL